MQTQLHCCALLRISVSQCSMPALLRTSNASAEKRMLEPMARRAAQTDLSPARLRALGKTQPLLFSPKYSRFAPLRRWTSGPALSVLQHAVHWSTGTAYVLHHYDSASALVQSKLRASSSVTRAGDSTRERYAIRCTLHQLMRRKAELLASGVGLQCPAAA